MKRQSSVYLSEKDFKKVEKLKEVYEAESLGALVKILIDNEITNVQKYENLNLNND